MRQLDAATLVPVHDHYGDGFDYFSHDPRCMGECYRCGGDYAVAYPSLCLYCEGGGCPGCNLYRLHQARERGLAA